jgi:hypothetical protein
MSQARLAAVLAAVFSIVVSLLGGCGDEKVIPLPQSVDGSAGMALPDEQVDLLGFDAGPAGPACTTDCDCAGGQRCSATSEVGRHCVAGENRCPGVDGGTVGAADTGTGTGADGGSSVVDAGGAVGADSGAAPGVDAGSGAADTGGPPPGPDAGPPPGPDAGPIGPSVAGKWKTTYDLDISPYAKKQQRIADLIGILQMAGQGIVSCFTLQSNWAKGICTFLAAVLVANKVTFPSWLTDLLNTLLDIFSYGKSDIRVQGVMNVTESGASLGATESWSSMMIDYKGQPIDLMSAPVLGSAGKVTVDVRPFGGSRTAATATFGPRDIKMDVDHLIVALVNVAINAATGGKAKDVGGLLSLLICSRITDFAQQLLCIAAATTAGNAFTTAKSGLGGVHIQDQRATIHDVDGNGIADLLGTASQRGTLTGTFSNGVVSAPLGPTSAWHAIR